MLASFLTPARQGERLLDLGAGCGVVALGMLCLHPGLEALGLDIRPELTEAACINAARLGLSGRYASLCRDVADPRALSGQEGAFSLVLANPPYRQRGSGRLPASPLRRVALFEDEGGLGAFCRAAGQALARDGRFGLIFPARRRDELLSALDEAGLTPVRLLPVRARVAAAPMLTLVEAMRFPASAGKIPAGSGIGPEEETPLVLHEKEGEATVFTGQALWFCPFLEQFTLQTVA